MSTWGDELTTAFGADAVTSCAVEGVERPLLSPRGDEEWSAAMHFARERKLSVLAIGRGSKLPWLPLSTAPDLVLSTRRDKGVVAFEPGDGTLTARAGTSIEELRAAALEHGYALTPDVARAGDKSLGGVIAAGESGFDRLRRGPVRHHVLGARLLRADGRIAKSGGALVKNVTGYDLHRLYTGSQGCLGIVLEASLRLCPAPEVRACHRSDFAERRDALRFARHLLALDLSVDALMVRRTDEGFATELFLGGREAVVGSELARLEPDPAARSTHSRQGQQAASLYAAARERELESPHLLLTTRRTAFEPCLDALDSIAEPGGIAAELLHPGIASASIELASPNDALPLSEIRSALPSDARIQSRGNLPTPVREELRSQPPTASGPAQRLAAQLRNTLDPEGRFVSVATR